MRNRIAFAVTSSTTTTRTWRAPFATSAATTSPTNERLGVRHRRGDRLLLRGPALLNVVALDSLDAEPEGRPTQSPADEVGLEAALCHGPVAHRRLASGELVAREGVPETMTSGEILARLVDEVNPRRSTLNTDQTIAFAQATALSELAKAVTALGGDLEVADALNAIALAMPQS